MLSPFGRTCISYAKFLREMSVPVARNQRYKSNKNPNDIVLPPEPTTCCMSGCANCVWIEYAQSLAKLFDNDDERALEIVLSKISDPNLKMFLQLELRKLKQLRETTNDKDANQ